ncbi:hypothetical protein N8634_00780 [bacterium]|nr:hypothetical protein [bacterium]
MAILSTLLFFSIFSFGFLELAALFLFRSSTFAHHLFYLSIFPLCVLVSPVLSLLPFCVLVSAVLSLLPFTKPIGVDGTPVISDAPAPAIPEIPSNGLGVSTTGMIIFLLIAGLTGIGLLRMKTINKEG